MAGAESTKRIGIGVAAVLLAVLVGWRLRSKGEAEVHGGAGSSSSVTPSSSAPVASGTEGSRPGLSAPIAAAQVANGEVLVAGLDVGAKAIRVQRIDVKDRVVAERTVLGDVAWSNDADLKLFAHPKEGAALMWRGLRAGK